MIDDNDNFKTGPDDTVTLIRRLNDRLRTTLTGGKVMMTAGIAALEPDVQAHVIAAVRTFDAFTEDNDPWAEHDFGAVEIDGQRVFFKVEYYDKSLRAQSPDATDPTVTTRVLTINPGQPGPDLTLPGEADAAFEAGLLTYYEIDGCSVVLLLSRSGADLLLDTP